MAYKMRFKDSVTLEKKTSEDANGKITYGTGTTVKCNIQTHVEDRESMTGSENISLAWIAFPSGTVIIPDDRITLPNGSQPKIVSVANRVNDITKKTLYVEVYLSSTVVL